MSVYEKFLDKNKSKLCESKSKKVSLRKLTKVNESDAYEKGYLDESCGKRKPKKPFLRKSLKESAKEIFRKKTFSKSKLSESKKEREEYLKKTFDDFKKHLIDVYSYLGGTITLGNAINKNLSDYPQEIQDFMSEIDLNKLNEISDNMRPIVKGVTKTFYDTYKYKN